MCAVRCSKCNLSFKTINNKASHERIFNVKNSYKNIKNIPPISTDLNSITCFDNDFPSETNYDFTPENTRLLHIVY